MLSLEHIASTSRLLCCNDIQIRRQMIQYDLDRHTVRKQELSIVQRRFLQLPEPRWRMSVSCLEQGLEGMKKKNRDEDERNKLKMHSGICTLKPSTTDRDLQ